MSPVLPLHCTVMLSLLHYLWLPAWMITMTVTPCHYNRVQHSSVNGENQNGFTLEYIKRSVAGSLRSHIFSLQTVPIIAKRQEAAVIPNTLFMIWIMYSIWSHPIKISMFSPAWLESVQAKHTDHTHNRRPLTYLFTHTLKLT